jgi:hypothetical protein
VEAQKPTIKWGNYGLQQLYGNDVNASVLCIYSLQISLNAEAIGGGNRKADMLEPYPSLILLIPESHTTGQSDPMQADWEAYL